MDFYDLGCKTAANFYNVLEDKLLDKWESASPTRLHFKDHLNFAEAGGLGGATLGSAYGWLMDPKLHTMSHPPSMEKDISTTAITPHAGGPGQPKQKPPSMFDSHAHPGDTLRLSEGSKTLTGMGVGGVTGALGLPAAVSAMKRYNVRNERRMLGRAGLGTVGALGAAGLLNHFLSRDDE